MKRKALMLTTALLPILGVSATMVGTDPSTYTPKYLSVPKFKECLSQTTLESATYWCLPKDKPTACPNDSWEELQQMNLLPCQEANSQNQNDQAQDN